jgi:predicted MPP superfamily phosphohydrolase
VLSSSINGYNSAFMEDFMASDSGKGEKKGLEFSLLHRTMEVFHHPATWPLYLVALAALGLVFLVMAVWRGVGRLRRVAGAAGLVHLAFLVSDAVLLRQLPRQRISYGPWQAQGAALATPRTAVALLLPLFSGTLGATGTLAAQAGFQALGSLLLFWGAVIEPRRLKMTQLELSLPGLAAGSRPVRVLHVSDIHMERISRREDDLLALAEASRPDLIVVTGDFLNLSYNRDREAGELVQRLLRGLHAPYGVFAVLGSPPVDLREIVPPLFDDVPARLLRDEWVTADLGEGRLVHILGLDCSHDRQGDGVRLARLAASGPEGHVRLLLYHSPELMPEAKKHGFDLYLCGHTHGGQVRLPLYGAVLTSSKLGKQYVMGHYREEDTHLYVSRGVGFEGLSAPRVRFLSPPEITLFTLRPPASTPDAA